MEQQLNKALGEEQQYRHLLFTKPEPSRMKVLALFRLGLIRLDAANQALHQLRDSIH